MAAGLLAGCATLDEQGVKVSQVPSPPAPRVITDATSSAEHKRMVALFGGEYRFPAVERYLNGVLAKFAATGELEGRTYRVTILNTPIVNAFALPSGDIFVTRGLLALANDGSEVAAVMAHEIAHVTERHAIARDEEQKRTAVISRVAHLVQNKQRGDQIEALGRLSIAGFSRQQELQADGRGIVTIAKAGFDPYGASRFLEALGRSAALRAALIGQNASAAKPDILATHPSTPDRIAAAVRAARGIAAPDVGTRDRDVFLSAVDGVMFGDDPAEGVIRGRRFIQPKLGFTLTAPDGFVLENSTQALLGVKEGGVEALRLDSVAAPEGTLDAYLHSGWIDGLVDSSVEKIEVNGLSAVTATARAGEWNFRLAVVALGDGTLYRIIFAAHGLDPARERAYRAAIDSFRKVGPDDAGRIKPLRVTLVAARAGDTLATLSQRMVVPDKPLETLALLNGLDTAAVLTPGERYKLVTE